MRYFLAERPDIEGRELLPNGVCSFYTAGKSDSQTTAAKKKTSVFCCETGKNKNLTTDRGRGGRKFGPFQYISLLLNDMVSPSDSGSIRQSKTILHVDVFVFFG